MEPLDLAEAQREIRDDPSLMKIAEQLSNDEGISIDEAVRSLAEELLGRSDIVITGESPE